MGGIGIWQLAIVAVIVVLLFGTKKLRNIGTDLGSAVKGFKKSIADEKDEESSVDSISADSMSADSMSDNSTTKKSVEVKEKDKV